MSTRNTDGAQARTDGTDPRPWTPVTDGNGDTPADIDDAEPDAGVVVRPDRTVWVAQDTRHNRGYHLYPDCHLHGDKQGPETAADIPARLKLCEHCEMRERVRVAVSDDAVPPNPEVEGAISTDPGVTNPPTTDVAPSTIAREQMADETAGGWLDGANGRRTNPRDAQ